MRQVLTREVEAEFGPDATRILEKINRYPPDQLMPHDQVKDTKERSSATRRSRAWPRASGLRTALSSSTLLARLMDDKKLCARVQGRYRPGCRMSRDGGQRLRLGDPRIVKVKATPSGDVT